MSEMTPQIVSKGAIRVIGMVYRGKNENNEIPTMWGERFLPRVHEIVPDTERWEAYGVCRMIDGLAPGEFEYIAAAGVDSLDNVPEGMVAFEIPAQTYAVLPANDVPDLGRVFDYLYNCWMKENGQYEPTDGPCVEYYPPTYSVDHQIYVHFPIQPKQG